MQKGRQTQHISLTLVVVCVEPRPTSDLKNKGGMGRQTEHHISLTLVVVGVEPRPRGILEGNWTKLVVLSDQVADLKGGCVL